MTLAVSPWTENGHEVSQQFIDDRLDLLVGGLTKDTGEDRMRHLCLNAFGRHGSRSHCLGGTRSAKGRHLVCSNDDTDDAGGKGTGCSIPVLSMCGNVDNGHAADHGDGVFHCWFGSKFEADFQMGCIEKGRGLVIRSALVMFAKLLSSHGAQDITKWIFSYPLLISSLTMNSVFIHQAKYPVFLLPI